MTTELVFSSGFELAERIRTKEVSPVEVVRAHLDRIQSINPAINAIVTVNDAALDQAREAERAVMRGERLGALHGVPFSVKEVFDTNGIPSTRGSLLYADRVPATDATAVQRLKDAGAIVIGKTNCPEFALSAETVNDLFGRTSNPWNLDRTSGGSSGGEAAAVSAGLSPLGIGTDLGGSNRLPSHYCSVVGFKPTHGLIPLTGSWPEIMSRRMHVGPISRSVRDIALSLTVLSGPDFLDPYATGRGIHELPSFGAPLPPLRVGLMTKEPFDPVMDEIEDVTRHAAAALDSQGCVVEDVTFDWHDRMPIDFTLDMLTVEANHYFKPFVNGRESDLSDSITGLLGSPMPSMSEYLEAMDKHESVSRDVTAFFSNHDLLLCPTSPVTAPPHNSAELDVSGRTVSASHAASITAAFGMTGHPAVSIPFGMSSEGLPIGVQLAASQLNDRLLLHAASALEEMSKTRLMRPPVENNLSTDFPVRET